MMSNQKRQFANKNWCFVFYGKGNGGDVPYHGEDTAPNVNRVKEDPFFVYTTDSIFWVHFFLEEIITAIAVSNEQVE
jgi:hypothetical protein